MGKASDMIRKILCGKRIDESKIRWVTYEVGRQDVVCFHLSTNPLLAFETDGQQYFFRECPPKQPEDAYIKEQIRRFFVFLENNQLEKINFAQEVPIQIDFSESVVADFRVYIEKRQEDDSFIRKLTATYQTLQNNGYSIWSEDPSVWDALFDQIGLEQITKELYDIAVYFMWYMRGAMATLDGQRAVSGKKRYYYNAVRTMATEETARALGAEALITPSQWCRLIIDGQERYGIASTAAPGKRALDVNMAPTGKLQRDLNRLNVLDVICFQQDHGPNNYNIDETGICSVCAFDNDNPNTFFPISKISWPLSGSDPFVTEKGTLNRPYMDKAMADALETVDEKRLKRNLRPYLNWLQIKSLLARVKQLRKLMRNACLLTAEQWNEETLQKELSGNYGKTYLCSFVNRSKQ